MTTTTCDICGKALDRNNNTNVRLPSIKFTIELSDNDGPGGSKRITACNFESGAVLAGYSGIPLLWKFDTTNIHFCDECVFNAFYRGVQDEFIKRQNAKLFKEATTIVQVQIPDPTAASFDLQPAGKLREDSADAK